MPIGRVPRVARWMVLAIRCHDLLCKGVVGSYRDLADLAGVTRVRVTQVMNLLHLASDIQESLLDLPRVSDPRTGAARTAANRANAGVEEAEADIEAIDR